MRTIQRDIAGAFIFSSDGLILLGKSIKGGVYQDSWMVPGGGAEPGETMLQAVIREIREEVGIDISAAKIEELSWVSTGQSEKVLRETGERVLVDMTFHDFKVQLSVKAANVALAFEDDLAIAQWFTMTELVDLTLSLATKHILEKMGCLPTVEQH